MIRENIGKESRDKRDIHRSIENGIG